MTVHEELIEEATRLLVDMHRKKGGGEGKERKKKF